MENYYLALVTTGAVFSFIYCTVALFVRKERLIFHRLVISALLVLMKCGELILCRILGKNPTSAIIFIFLFSFILCIHVFEWWLNKKFHAKENKED